MVVESARDCFQVLETTITGSRFTHGYFSGASLSTIEESNFLPRDDFDCPISLTIRIVKIPRPQTGRNLGIFILNQ